MGKLADDNATAMAAAQPDIRFMVTPFPRQFSTDQLCFGVNSINDSKQRSTVNATSAHVAVSAPQPLFDLLLSSPRYEYDVSGDPQRFLLITRGDSAATTTEMPLTVLVNWTAALKK